MDEGDFYLDNGFDSSVMRSGIPKSIDKVEPLGEGSADLVYRNVDVMSSSSVLRAAGSDGDSMLLRGVGVDIKPITPMLFQSVTATKPTGARVTGKYQLMLFEPLQAATLRVDSFLKEHLITSAHRLEASTHCWDCHTVSDSCQLVKFQIQSVQGEDGVTVSFRRERGCCEALAQTFDMFCRDSNAESAPSRAGRFRMQPPPLPDEDESTDSCSAIQEALLALSQWIQSSPVEALQSLGQLYGNKCKHLLRSENVLSDVCKAIKTNETEGSDMITLTLALSCLRRILSIYSEMGSPSPLTADRVAAVTGGLARASRGKCLTARREANRALEIINLTVSADLKIVNL